MWVLVMQKAQWTGAKRLAFFKSTTQGIATYQKFTPCTCERATLRDDPSPILLLHLSTGNSPNLEHFLCKSFFFFYFLQKPYFFSSTRQVRGIWFMELREKCHEVGMLKEAGLLPRRCKMHGSGAWDSAAPSSITADACCACTKAKADKR